jgi:hypothetical protein
MRAICCAALTIALLSAPLSARKEAPPPPPMPAGYDNPGPSPENALAKVFANLRTTLKDPYSIRDFKLCEPRQIEAYYGIDWVRAHWIVTVNFNAKNSYGGYTGPTQFDVEFENGEAVRATQFDGIDLLTPVQNAKLLAMSQACPKVPDTEIHRLLAE